MTKEFSVAIRNAISELDEQSERPLRQRLKGVYVNHFANLRARDIPDKYRPQHRVLKNRLEDFVGSEIDASDESAGQIERQLRGLLEAVSAHAE